MRTSFFVYVSILSLCCDNRSLALFLFFPLSLVASVALCSSARDRANRAAAMADDEGAPAAIPAPAPAPAAEGGGADAAAAADADASEAPPPAFRSRSSCRGCNIRRRKAASAAADSDDEDAGVALNKKARQEAQGLQVAGGSKKASDAASNDEPTAAATTGARFVSDRKLQESGDALATATLETETEFDRDAR